MHTARAVLADFARCFGSAIVHPGVEVEFSLIYREFDHRVVA